MSQLPPNLADSIKTLCSKGYTAYDAADYAKALRLFYQAWLQIPKPQSEWTEAGWVLTAIGDAYFRSDQYQQAIEALRSALHCPEIDCNPFVHLRLGQALLDDNQPEPARTHLLIAFRLGGDKLFANETERYREQIQDLLTGLTL